MFTNIYLQLRISKRVMLQEDGSPADDAFSPWNYLPDIPLINIYSHLGWEDRANASQVCRRWSGVFGVAGNWRNVRVFVTGKPDSEDYGPTLKFITKFGHHLHKATIHYRGIHISEEEAVTALHRFRSLCFILSEKVQLTSLLLENFEMLFQQGGDYVKGSVITCLLHLLSSQDRLRVVDFRLCGFAHNIVSKMFSAIRNRSLLSEVRLYDLPLGDEYDEEDYEEYDDDDEEGDGYEDEAEDMNDTNEEEREESVHWFCGCLNSLTLWDGSYSPLLETLVTTFATHLKRHKFDNHRNTQGVLRHMRIQWEGWFRELRGISDESWGCFNKLFPHLQVDLRIDTIEHDIDPRYVMKFLLRRNIPLRNLTFVVDDCSTTNYETLSLHKLFDHIVHRQLHLEIEFLRIENFSPVGFLAAFTNFGRWSNLHTLEIVTPYPLNFLKEVLWFLVKVESPKRLQIISIEFIKTTRWVFNHQSLSKIERKFTTRFQRKGITFTIISKDDD